MDHLHFALCIFQNLILFGISMVLTWFGICLIVEGVFRLSNGLLPGTIVWALLWAAAFSYHEAYVRPLSVGWAQ